MCGLRTALQASLIALKSSWEVQSSRGSVTGLGIVRLPALRATRTMPQLGSGAAARPHVQAPPRCLGPPANPALKKRQSPGPVWDSD